MSTALKEIDEEATLVLAPEVLRELRLALVAELRSVGEELLAILAEPETALAGGALQILEKRRRWREVTRAITTRHELHEIAGWPAEPPAQRTITGDPHCALAIEILTRRRDTLAAQPTRDDLDPEQTATAHDAVGHLSRFLDDAAIEPERVTAAASGPSAGPGESCQD